MREVSLSGIANRYVDLHLGAGHRSGDPDGGVIPAEHTTSEVDLDQCSTRSTPPTRKGLQNLFRARPRSTRARARSPGGVGVPEPGGRREQHAVRQINRNTGNFTNFIVKTERSGDRRRAAQRRPQRPGPAPLDDDRALAAERVPLGESLQQLPGFMALADTTFVNLRARSTT